VDILGPFPRAVGGYWYLFVTIDKFTKWPEATPSRIIMDNGTQFTSRIF
jgi:hypothetical protein